MSAVLVAATMIAFVGLGYEIAIRRWRGIADPFELWSAAACIGAALWLASVWALALLQLLNRPAMIARTVLVVLAALALVFLRNRSPRAAARELHVDFSFTLLSLPFVAWIAFIAWRSAVVPPLSHDALAYHLPRAVLWIRGGGYSFLDLPIDLRVRQLPANYEMLLADVMLLGEGDRLTEWIGLFFFVAFCVVCGGLAQRWWPKARLAPAAVMLLAASVPVLLLHSGADKNDVMVAFFIVSSLLWAGRWLSESDVGALVLSLIALIAAIGTKPQGLMLAVCWVPVVGAGWLRSRRRHTLKPSALAWVLAACIGAATLLGGAFYVSRILHESSRSGGAEQAQFVAYDDWQNLWQAPWVLLTAPFSPWSEELYVPWSERPWFWRRTELYFSHLGVPFALSVLALPFAFWGFRRECRERALERHAIAAAALGVFLLMLPVRDVPMPHGVYMIALPRYVLFLVPVVFALTVTPAVRALETRGRSTVIAVILALWFVSAAFQTAANDRFVPPAFVEWASRHRGTRVIPFDPRRAASIADTLAAESEPIAMDAGYAAWIHPAFGRSLRRPVSFIEPGGGPPRIPADAQWVAIDRGFRISWQHPGFRDLSQSRLFLNAGKPTDEDTKVLRWLIASPDFELVFFNRQANQAVFRRR